MKEYGRRKGLRERILLGPVERLEGKVQVMLFVVFFFFLNLITSFNHTPQLLIEFPDMSVFVSPTDESSEEEAREVTKEEHDLGVVKSWMEVGVFPHLLKRKCRDYYMRYILFLPGMFQSLNSFYHFPFLSLIFVMDLKIVFQGLDLKRASALREEAQ